MVDGSRVFGYFIFSLLLSVGFVGIIDLTYKLPQAAETANQICQSEGYDFYERFERIGFFSNEPVAIECKYVQNYQEMNIALRQYFGDELQEVQS